MERINDTYVITCNPEFASQCIDELSEIDSRIRVIENLEEGTFAVKGSMDRQVFEQQLLDEITLFLRHIHRVDYIFDIKGTSEDFEVFREVIERYEAEGFSSKTIAVQIRKSGAEHEYSPLDLKDQLDDFISSHLGCQPVIKDADIIVSLFLTKNKCYFGISPVKYNLSSWRGGMHHYKKGDNDISRARFKLMEAIERFNIDMTSVKSALDLGAAPGGWTSVLLEYGTKVTSVETGDLDERLVDNRNVEFIKENASELKLKNRSFDIITCDMSWNPVNTVDMLLKFEDNLKSGGYVVFTLKLMHSNVWKTVREVEKKLTQHFKLINGKQLFHNRREVTLLLQKY